MILYTFCSLKVKQLTKMHNIFKFIDIAFHHFHQHCISWWATSPNAVLLNHSVKTWDLGHGLQSGIIPVHIQAHLVQEIWNQQTIVWACHLFLLVKVWSCSASLKLPQDLSSMLSFRVHAVSCTNILWIFICFCNAVNSHFRGIFH